MIVCIAAVKKHGLLNEPLPRYFRLKIDVFLRPARAHGDVMDSYDKRHISYLPAIISPPGSLLKRGAGLRRLLPAKDEVGLEAPAATPRRSPYSRVVEPGDIIIIPPDVFHGWTKITDHVDYLSVRPDPDRVLPAGYVNPAIKK